MSNIFKKLKYLSHLERGEHQQINKGGRDWENQVHDYPETSPEMPDFEPRGASFSWYHYPTALEAWQSIANDPDKMKRYKEARGMGGFVCSNWDEVSLLLTAQNMVATEFLVSPSFPQNPY